MGYPDHHGTGRRQRQATAARHRTVTSGIGRRAVAARLGADRPQVAPPGADGLGRDRLGGERRDHDRVVAEQLLGLQAHERAGLSRREHHLVAIRHLAIDERRHQQEQPERRPQRRRRTRAPSPRARASQRSLGVRVVHRAARQAPGRAAGVHGTTISASPNRFDMTIGAHELVDGNVVALGGLLGRVGVGIRQDQERHPPPRR